jgi:hypothetical protein
MFDPKKNVILSIYDFFTTANNQLSVSKYLLTFLDLLCKHIPAKCDKLPSTLVMDFSWVLLNSSLFVFNNMTIHTYIKQSFDLFTNTENGLANFKQRVKVKIYICSTHFLKIIVKKVKNVNENDEAKKAFIFAFTLLQNSSTFIEFEEILQKIYTLFHSEFINQNVSSALFAINQKVLGRKEKLTALFLVPENDASDESDDFYFSQDESLNTVEGVKKNSPFTEYFLKKKKTYMHELGKEKSNQGNDYFCPQFCSILEEYLHIVPLWTGIVLSNNGHATTDVVTRLSNNMVENWIGSCKDDLFIDQNLFPHQIALILHENAQAVYINHYLSSENKGLLLAKKNDDSFYNQMEIWMRNNQNKNLNKGYFYKNKWKIQGFYIFLLFPRLKMTRRAYFENSCTKLFS